jgi:quercetin dioxygenase-like cupin family protein
VTSRHVVRRAADATFAAIDADWARAGTGFTRWSVLDETTRAAIHTGFGICVLEPAGSVPAHVHSYEECFFMLDGEVELRTEGRASLLRSGDYGILSVGEIHSWHAVSESGDPARWAEMVAPQPRSRFGGDTFAVPALASVPARPVDPRDPRTRSLGHIAPANMDAARQSQEQLALSASMRTALLVYSGITVKMMVDSDLGADLTTMFMVQYGQDGVAGRHDHPFEETYLFLEGEAEAEFDGEQYRLGPGDIAFAGAGCVHGFRNVGHGLLRWLETQAPQPPRRHSYRFARDWEYLSAVLDKEE